MTNQDKELDNLWSKLVKLKAKNKCEVCGTPNSIQSHHIFSRHNKSTRWDVDNGICLCVEHHTEGSVFSAHKTPNDFIEWLERYKGEDFVNDIRLKSNQLGKFTSHEKKEMIKELKEQITTILKEELKIKK